MSVVSYLKISKGLLEILALQIVKGLLTILIVCLEEKCVRTAAAIQL
jgi:hypothetical protein